ncbi:MAG: hypothetical protein LQ344_006823 [Seirophora lacunosa]|nr:MAG: hypothetical protein LQ344_006823 [Seirophora lacunosa]
MAYYNFTTFDIIGNVMAAIRFVSIERCAAIYPAINLALKVLKKVTPSIEAKRILQHNDERGMNRDEIIGTSRVMLVAGAETTATLLGGATYILLQNPSMMHRAQSEVRGTFKNADDITLRAVSTPGLLPYLDAVLQESLRCRPPVPAAFPRKTAVGVHQWSTYRSSANFASPDTFDPERFLPSPPEKYRNDNVAALQPFSVGPRGCIGKSYV